MNLIEGEFFIGLKDIRLLFVEIDKRINRSRSTVYNCWKVWWERGARNSGRRRATNERQDRRLRSLALRDRFVTTHAIANQWFTGEKWLLIVISVYHKIPFYFFLTVLGLYFLSWWDIAVKDWGDVEDNLTNLSRDVYIEWWSWWMILGVITCSSWSPLVFIKDNLTAQWYVQEIVVLHLLPFYRSFENPVF